MMPSGGKWLAARVIEQLVARQPLPMRMLIEEYVPLPLVQIG